MSRSSRRAILLADGYNIIGLWPRLRDSHAIKGLETARRDLIEILVNYSASEGLEARIVFDSQYQYSPKLKEVVTEHLSVYYTEFGQTADAYIEKSCADLRQELHLSKKRLIVATSDRAVRQIVVGYGAESMSVEQLANAVEAAISRTRERYQPQKQSKGRFLFSSLDPESQKKLAQLRMGRK